MIWAKETSLNENNMLHSRIALWCAPPWHLLGMFDWKADMYLFCTQTDCNQPEMMMIGYDSWLSGESHQATVEQQVTAGSLSLVSVQHTPEHLWLHARAGVIQTRIAAAALSVSQWNCNVTPCLLPSLFILYCHCSIHEPVTASR